MPRKLLASLAASLLLVTAGCGGDAPDDQVLTGDAAIAALQAAPDAAAEAGSGRFEMTMSFSMGGDEVTISATGAFSGDRFQMTMDFGAIAEQLGEAVPDGVDMSMEAVGEGASFFMRMPFLQEMVGGGAEWISVTPEDLGVASEALGLGAGANDPSKVLEVLRGAGGDLEELGTQEVRGVETTGFRVDVDLAEAFTEMPEELRDLVEQQLGTVAGSMPVEVWLDADQLPRRVSMDMSALLGQVEGAGGGQVVMEFFDYGDEITIELPDPADVQPFADVLGGFGGEQFEETGEAIN